MANKDYWLQFGSGDPRSNTGLSPTFVIFQTVGGTMLPGPAVTEPGASTGLYYFSYGTTTSIAFTVDGGSGLSSSDRYITGVLDPIQVVDQRVGLSSDSFGDTAIIPATVLGMLNRNLEINEGNQEFNKTTGVWNIYNRGATTLIRSKTLSNSSSEVERS